MVDILGSGTGTIASGWPEMMSESATEGMRRLARSLGQLDHTEDLVSAVSRIDGAARLRGARDSIRAGDLVPMKLDGRCSEPKTLPDYPFWTVDYL